MTASTRLVEIFCAVVEAGNYTSAAKRLGVTPAAVSRAITRYEANLGVALFRRSTRSVQLTDAGRSYYDRCRQVLALLDEAERSLSAAQDEPSGVVRLSVPTTYGHARIMPIFAEASARWPRVTLEVDVANTNVDLIGGHFDLAVRMGALGDSSRGDSRTRPSASSRARATSPRTAGRPHRATSRPIAASRSSGRAPGARCRGCSLAPTARSR